MNLFELFVKVGVDDQASGKLKDISSKLGDGLKTAAKVGTAAVGVASAAIAAFTTQAVNSFAEYEQLAGGAQKIFDQMDYSKIATDANNAYKELGLSANQYLAVINDVGATFAATMGDEAGYEAAKTGLKAISDYASGTGKNVDELSQKFTLITRSTSSYQSIADQFSGILPATSAGFLEQAQAAGILSDKYTQLTQVPIDEYQAAVSQMLQQGVTDLGLANNTMNEAFSTLSGSLSMAKGAWRNLVTGLADDSADLDMLVGNFVESVGAAATNIIPKISVALNGAAKLIEKVVPTIVKEIPKIIQKNLPVLAKAAVSIVKSLVDGISENQKMLFDTVFDVVTYISETFLEMLPDIVQLGLDLLVSFAEGIADNLEKLAPTIVSVMEKIVSTLTDPVTLDKLITAAVDIVDTLADMLLRDTTITQLIDAAVDLVQKLVDKITEEDTLGKLIDAAIQIITKLSIALIDNVDDLLDAAVKIIEGLVGYFFSEKGLKALGGAAVDILSKLGTGLINAATGLKDVAESILTKLGDALSDFSSTVTDVATDIAGDIADAFEEGGWYDVGRYILEGIWDGMSAYYEWFSDNVNGLIDGLVDGVEDLLGIASPSKVFKRIGGFTAEGFGIGFEDEFSKVRGDMEDAMDFENASIGINASIRKVGAGAAGGAFGGTSIGNININIDGARYDDEQSLASAIALEIQNMTDRRSAVYV